MLICILERTLVAKWGVVGIGRVRKWTAYLGVS